MPFGGNAIGVVYFAGIKYAGYSAAGVYANRAAGVDRPHPLVFGAARTLLGVAAGLTYALAASTFEIPSAGTIFLLGLIPVRVLEWYGTFWWFYRDRPSFWSGRWVKVELGILWSFALDLPAILAAIVIPGGFWIC